MHTELGRKPTLLYSGPLGHHRSGSWGCISFHTRHYQASLHRQQDGFTGRLRMIRKKGIRLYLTLIKVLGLTGLLAKNTPTNHIELFKRGQPSVLLA